MTDFSNERGYWLIEIPELEQFSAQPSLDEFGHRFFQWLADEVSGKLHLADRLIELTSITAEYHGKYPCLAARHLAEEISEDVSIEIVDTIRLVMRETSLSAFLEDLAKQRPEKCGLPKTREP